MRVLFLTNMPSPYRVDFFNELGKKCELTVMFERKRDSGRDERYKAGRYENFKAIFPKGVQSGDAEAFCPGVLGLLSKRKFEHIIVGNYYSPTGMLAIEYMRLRKIPFILSTDGGMIKEDSKFKYRLKRHFIGAASGWLSTGKITTEYLVHYGADRLKTVVYPFTSIREKDILDKPLTQYEKYEIRKKLGMSEEKIVISVGQFIYRKGYDILLQACEKLADSVGVYIIGGKPTEEYLKMKRELKLNQVHFIDFMDKNHLAEYYKAADLFVLPTREDIWGLVVNEAMSYGLPVITTDKCVAGIELIKNGQNGNIVSNENPSLLAEACNEILTSNLMKLGMTSLNIIKKYTIENMSQTHWEFLKKQYKN